MSSADAELFVAKTKSRTSGLGRPHEHDKCRELTIYFLHRDRGGRIFSGGPAVRHPISGLGIAHQFVGGPVSLDLKFTDHVLRIGDLTGAAHKIDRDCVYGLRLVIKNLDGLGIVENIEVLLVTFVTRVA